MKTVRVDRPQLYPITKSDLNALFEMSKGCYYVNENPDYREKASKTKFYFESENPTVNAYATTESFDGVSYSYRIVLFGGFCEAVRFGSIAAVEFLKTANLDKLILAFKWAGNKIIKSQGQFTLEDTFQGLVDCQIETSENFIRESKSYLAGGVLTTIAHELGHICLSHVLRDYDSNNLSRNDERAADLFSWSIAEASPFTGQAVFGGLIQEILLAWLDGGHPETTHPTGRERVYNLIASHRDYLKSLGITENNIDRFLP